MPAVQPRTLISAAAITARVKELGRRITEDYRQRRLVLVGVLDGAFIFLGDLCRRIELPLECDFLAVGSYGDGTTSSGRVKLTRDLTREVAERDVLIVEDIVDSGLTAEFLLKHVVARGSRSVALCTLLRKEGRTTRDVPVDYLGFTVPDKFVVGYGMDHAGCFRNLPYIGTLENL